MKKHHQDSRHQKTLPTWLTQHVGGGTNCISLFTQVEDSGDSYIRCFVLLKQKNFLVRVMGVICDSIKIQFLKILPCRYCTCFLYDYHLMFVICQTCDNSFSLFLSSKWRFRNFWICFFLRLFFTLNTCYFWEYLKITDYKKLWKSNAKIVFYIIISSYCKLVSQNEQVGVSAWAVIWFNLQTISIKACEQAHWNRNEVYNR